MCVGARGCPPQCTPAPRRPQRSTPVPSVAPCCLLAGGVREAYKRRGEDYQLFWPEKSGGWLVVSRLRAAGCWNWFARVPAADQGAYPPPIDGEQRKPFLLLLLGSVKRPSLPPPCPSPGLLPFAPAEFIRMAARFGATIVPFAAVGVDDSLNIIADSTQLEALPVVGDALRRRAGSMPQVCAVLHAVQGRQLGGRCPTVGAAAVRCHACTACAGVPHCRPPHPPAPTYPPTYLLARRGAACRQLRQKRRASLLPWLLHACPLVGTLGQGQQHAGWAE